MMQTPLKRHFCKAYWFPCPSGQKCIDLLERRSRKCNPQQPCDAKCRRAGKHLPAARCSGADFLQHLKLCVRFPCPFSDGKCASGVLYGSATEHLRECQGVQVPCFFGCGQMIAINHKGAEVRHLIGECEQFKIGCTRSCGVEPMPLKDLASHLALRCDKNVMQCFMRGCHARCSKKNMADHLEKDCAHFLMSCESWPERWIDGDPGWAPTLCMSRAYCKKDEVHHVSVEHVENPLDRRTCQPTSRQREGLEEGSAFERLTAQSLAGLASIDLDEKAQAEMKFVEHALSQIHLEPERFLCPSCGEDLDVDDDAAEVWDACQKKLTINSFSLMHADFRRITTKERGEGGGMFFFLLPQGVVIKLESDILLGSHAGLGFRGTAYLQSIPTKYFTPPERETRAPPSPTPPHPWQSRSVQEIPGTENLGVSITGAHAARFPWCRWSVQPQKRIPQRIECHN